MDRKVNFFCLVDMSILGISHKSNNEWFGYEVDCFVMIHAGRPFA